MTLAPYSEALNDPTDHSATLARSAVLVTPINERAQYVARLIAENATLRQKISDLEQDLLHTDHAGNAELEDARQQHADDQEKIYNLECKIRELDMLAETRTYERDDAKKRIEEVTRRFKGHIDDLERRLAKAIEGLSGKLVRTMARNSKV